MRIVWSADAEQDRADIFDYISADNLAAAERMDLRFSASVNRLGELPLIGRPGAMEGTRELIPHQSYRIVYEVSDEVVRVLAIVHASRQWPPVTDEDDA